MQPALSTAPNAAIPFGARRKAEDASPKTLYVSRPLINAAPLIEWAKQAGFKTTMPADEMHVTIAFSKTPVDWDLITPIETNLATGESSRKVEPLGDLRAVVLRFDSPELQERWKELGEAGAKWDYPVYKPHVTISYDAGDVDIDSVEPYAGPLEFGPEVFKEVGMDWANKLKAKSGASDSALTLALDRDSVREYDRDGRLRVARTHISKANVCPYRGEEIPGWQKLMLDPDKIYNLLRHPEELQKGAQSLNGVPLLRKHVPVNADDHKPDEVVGSLGTDAEFDGEYLDNSLFVNARDAIDGINSGKRRELSAGYHYTPDMTPGNFNGKAYDGVMRDIVFNHVALVEDGRAGPDVVVGDSMENVMKPTRYAVLALSTVGAAISPLLAMDSKVTLPKDLFSKLTPKNFKDQKAALLTSVRAAVDGKLRKGLALDASMAGLAKAIDAFEELEADAAPEEMETAANVGPVDQPEPEKKDFPAGTFDAEPLKGFLREKGMGEDDISKVCDLLPKPALDADETPEEKAEREKKEAEAKAAKDSEMKDMVSKPAMDAALKAHGETVAKQVSDQVTKAVRETERGIRSALADVKPWVGELPAGMAFDSAADVHRHALKMLKVEGADTLHTDALLPILKAQTLPGAKPVQHESSKIAMDADGISKARKYAPGLENIQTVT